MIDIRQSENYARYLMSQGWIIEKKDNVNYFIKKVHILGSILKIQRTNRINFQFIDELESKYKVFQTIIEPDLDFEVTKLIANGYLLSSNPFLPSKTLQIDLTQPIAKIYANFIKDCKYAIRKASGPEGLRPGGGDIKITECSTPKEIKMWHTAWKNSVKFDRFVPSLESLLNIHKSFSNKKSLFLASHNISGRIIGGALFTVSSHGRSNYISYYWAGFTNSEGRSSLSQYSLLYHGVLWAKRMGCKIFDFEGIYDERFPNKNWIGFSHFKKSFGGQEVLYPGCYTKYRLPI